MNEGSARYAHEDGTWILRLEGDVRHPLSPAINALLDRAFGDPGLRNFAVDLSKAEAIDSTNLGVLARIANHMTGAGLPRATLVAPGTDILTVLRAVCFDRIFAIVPEGGSIDAALEELPGAHTDQREALEIVLEAHRRLCAIDEGNLDAFRDVVELLERELHPR